MKVVKRKNAKNKKASHERVASSNWKRNGKYLSRTIKFNNFMSALIFVNNVAEIAEKMNHHPDVILKYGEVTFNLTTHDKGGITQKDFALAQSIDKLGR